MMRVSSPNVFFGIYRYFFLFVEPIVIIVARESRECTENRWIIIHMLEIVTY